MNDFALIQQLSQTRVKALLSKTFAHYSPPLTSFFEALNYASLDGGKRIRAMLTFAVGAYLSVPDEELDIYATAIELIHAFSLVHDDLPAMDNDVLRRGKATCHVAFGESTAILAGDALLTQAFLMLSGIITPYFNSVKRVKIINALAQASGAKGMAGGQFLDMQAEGQALNLEDLLELHRLKTGKLIETCASLPLIYAEPDAAIHLTLTTLAQHLGLLFQIQDDLLDHSGNHEKLGKTPGKDLAKKKASFLNTLGQAQTLRLLKEKEEAAQACLSALPGNTTHLQLVLDFILTREY